MTTIDLTDPAWPATAEPRIRAWLDTQAQIDVAADFGYEGTDYETVLAELVTHACGYGNDEELFTFPDGVRGEFDLVDDGEGAGSLGFVRYLLATPTGGPLRGAALASTAHDLKNSTDDRSAVGADAAVAILTCAAAEYATLLGIWRTLTAAG